MSARSTGDGGKRQGFPAVRTHSPVTHLPRMVAQSAFAPRTAEVIDGFLAGPPEAHEKECSSGCEENCYPQNNPNGDVPHTRHRLPLRSSGSKRVSAKLGCPLEDDGAMGRRGDTEDAQSPAFGNWESSLRVVTGSPRHRVTPSPCHLVTACGWFGRMESPVRTTPPRMICARKPPRWRKPSWIPLAVSASR